MNKHISSNLVVLWRAAAARRLSITIYYQPAQLSLFPPFPTPLFLNFGSLSRAAQPAQRISKQNGKRQKIAESPGRRRGREEREVMIIKGKSEKGE